MVTLFLGGYKQADLFALLDALETGFDRMTKDCDKNCNFCDHKTACFDIERAIEYANNTISERERRRFKYMRKKLDKPDDT